jgi:hypothetical protein
LPQQPKRELPVGRTTGAVAHEGGVNARGLAVSRLGRPAEEVSGRSQIAANDLSRQAPAGKHEKGLRIGNGLRAGQQTIGFMRPAGGEQRVGLRRK